jgi:hypothetical protein
LKLAARDGHQPLLKKALRMSEMTRIMVIKLVCDHFGVHFS